MNEIRIQAYWPSCVAVIAAMVLAGWSYHVSTAQRMALLDLSVAGGRDTYVVRSKSDPSRCYLVDRRQSTMRRSDAAQAGHEWTLTEIGPTGQADRPATWLVCSKRLGKGAIFFVPVEDVPDWTYPFLYEFVRTHTTQSSLPEARWTQLYIDRVYQGLYLRAALPFDPRKKDGGSGALRELLSVEGHWLNKVDTRFDAANRLYADRVAGGCFPELNPPSPEVAWLAQRRPFPETTFLMSNKEPYGVELLPLPISLSRLRKRMDGGVSPPAFLDDRYVRWTHGPWRTSGAGAMPFASAVAAELPGAFAEYASSLVTALGTHAEFHGTKAPIEEQLPARGQAVADLNLHLGGL